MKQKLFLTLLLLLSFNSFACSGDPIQWTSQNASKLKNDRDIVFFGKLDGYKVKKDSEYSYDQTGYFTTIKMIKGEHSKYFSVSNHLGSSCSRAMLKPSEAYYVFGNKGKEEGDTVTLEDIRFIPLSKAIKFNMEDL